MKIRDNTNQADSLYHLALRWALTTTTEFPFDPDAVQSANVAMDKLNALIRRYDNTWEYQDTNVTDPLIEEIDLTSGTPDYPILNKYKKIRRVRVKDNGGNFYTLSPKSRGEMSDSLIDDQGQPKYYDKLGNKLYLFPKPNYTVTDGIEIEFQPGGSYFGISDTTKEPGFNEEFHEAVALYMALDYLLMNGNDQQAKRVMERLGQEPLGTTPGTGILGAMARFYVERDADRPQSISLAKSNRARGLI